MTLRATDSTAAGLTDSNDDDLSLELRTSRAIAREQSCHPYLTLPRPMEFEWKDLVTAVESSTYFSPNQATALEPTIDNMRVLLDCMSQMANRATGASIYVIAAWDDGAGGTRIYESVDDRLEHILGTEHCTAMRHEFIRLVHGDMGPTMMRDIRSAWPCVAGFALLGFRPLLPPEHPEVEQERWVVFRVITAIQAWQALPEIDWQALDADVKEERFLLIDGWRLPQGMTCFDHPRNWPASLVRLMARWIRNGQEILERRDVARYYLVFEFRELNSHEIVHMEAHPDSTLTFSAEESIYYASCLSSPVPPDAYMTRANGPSLIHFEARSAILACPGIDIKKTSEIIDAINRYEATNPPRDREETESNPALYLYLNLETHDILHFLNEPRLPDPFIYFRHPMHKLYNPGPYLRWLVNGGLMAHEETPLRLYGGCKGVIRPLILAAQIKKTIHWAQSIRSPDVLRFGSHYNDIANRILNYLSSALRSSDDVSSTIQQVHLPAGHRLTPWKAQQISWHNRLSTGADVPSDVEPIPNQTLLGYTCFDSEEPEFERVTETTSSDPVDARTLLPLRPPPPSLSYQVNADTVIDQQEKYSQFTRGITGESRRLNTDVIPPIELPLVSGSSTKYNRSQSETNSPQTDVLSSLGLSIDISQAVKEPEHHLRSHQMDIDLPFDAPLDSSMDDAPLLDARMSSTPRASRRLEPSVPHSGSPLPEAPPIGPPEPASTGLQASSSRRVMSHVEIPLHRSFSMSSKGGDLLDQQTLSAQQITHDNATQTPAPESSRVSTINPVLSTPHKYRVATGAVPAAMNSSRIASTAKSAASSKRDRSDDTIPDPVRQKLTSEPVESETRGSMETD
ncbi:hypothetical protein RhiJN_15051 [Ceratobasidium sp. AG-Ba]|nr:hypothetical protein RhiJN_15051 [Ceratobasidium sp. AG-Ba]